MEYGILLLRLVVGLAFAGHGAQKLFGWFGGYGPRGTAGFFGSIGYRWPVAMAVLAGLAEFVGGLLFALGLLTPLAALALTIVMLNAIVTVRWQNGFWSQNNGYEFELTLMAVALAVAATGPGRLSLDRAVGWDDEITGLSWAVGALVIALAVAFATTTIGRARPQATEVPA